jgi:hypothetical protein
METRIPLTIAAVGAKKVEPRNNIRRTPAMNSPNRPGFIPPHGAYQKLLSYQKAEVIYDLTFHFCERFLKRDDRTIDQMIQAARSGKQNIAEGSQASGSSKEPSCGVATL